MVQSYLFKGKHALFCGLYAVLENYRRYFGSPVSKDNTALNSNTSKVTYITVTLYRYYKALSWL